MSRLSQFQTDSQQKVIYFHYFSRFSPIFDKNRIFVKRLLFNPDQMSSYIKKQLQLMLQHSGQTFAKQYTMNQRYRASMILAAVGDAMGYYRGHWEFTYNGQEIHKSMMRLTHNQGIKALKIDQTNFPYSDDTVMHIATAEGLILSSPTASLHEICTNIAKQYKKCMKYMQGRAPGATCIRSTNMLWNDGANWDKIPFAKNAGGCGASMRAACIGLYYPYDMTKLMEISIESGRTTHHNPLGYLGSYVAALFTAFAIQEVHPNRWLSLLLSKHLPQAKKYIENNRQGKQNLSTGDWTLFEQLWTKYAQKREMSLQDQSVPKFPQKYGVSQREDEYHQFAVNGWPGALGVDSVIIAYDALLSSLDQKNRRSQDTISEVTTSQVNLWQELCLRGVLHGGDNDSTGTIAGAWYGALYGFKQVYPINYASIQDRDRLIKLGDDIYKRVFVQQQNGKPISTKEQLQKQQITQASTNEQQGQKENLK